MTRGAYLVFGMPAVIYGYYGACETQVSLIDAPVISTVVYLDDEFVVEQNEKVDGRHFCGLGHIGGHCYRAGSVTAFNRFFKSGIFGS